MSVPVSGEHHERAVEAADRAMNAGWFCALGPLRTAIDAYHASLAEQGIRLVDLREVAQWLGQERGYERAAAAIEYRFGSVSE